MSEEGSTADTRAHRAAAGGGVVSGMFGQAFLDRTMSAAPADAGPMATMGRLALEQCYGDIWTRPGLGLRDRSLVTLGILIATGHHDELANHIRGARGNGVTRDELAEVMLQAVPYVGFPAAGQAMQVLARTWPEDAEDQDR